MEPKTYEARVDDRFDVAMQIADLEALDIRPAGPGRWHFIHDGRSFHVEVEEADYPGKQFVLRVDGSRHRIRIADPYDVLVQRLGLAKKAAHAINEIKAPMPGLIREVLVVPGQSVEAGDPVVILEAMKMENTIRSPGAGVVAKVPVDQGKAVEKGQVLVTFE